MGRRYRRLVTARLGHDLSACGRRGPQRGDHPPALRRRAPAGNSAGAAPRDHDVEAEGLSLRDDPGAARAQAALSVVANRRYGMRVRRRSLALAVMAAVSVA